MAVLVPSIRPGLRALFMCTLFLALYLLLALALFLSLSVSHSLSRSLSLFCSLALPLSLSLIVGVSEITGWLLMLIYRWSMAAELYLPLHSFYIMLKLSS